MTTDSIGGADALRPGTVLSFRFPLGEGEGRVKTRPCLVIARTLGERGEPLVTIAYGTSAGTQSNRGLDIKLAEPEVYRAVGLRRPTRFVLMRWVTVPLSDPGLDARRAESPVIGTLPPTAMVTLRQLTRSLGATLTEDHRRGSVGTAARGRPDGRLYSRRDPVIVRVAGRRYERPAARSTEPRAGSTMPQRAVRASPGLTAGRPTLRLLQRSA